MARIEKHYRPKALVRRQATQRRVHVDDTSPRITYESPNWSVSTQNLTGVAYNATAMVTTTSGSWVRMPFAGGSLSFGLLYNGLPFSGQIEVDDGAIYRFSVPLRNSTPALTAHSLRYDHVACGNHTAILTVDMDVPSNSSDTQPEVYFDWFSYPLTVNGECETPAVQAATSPNASELKTVVVTVASAVAGFLILGILALLLRRRYRNRHLMREESSKQSSNTSHGDLPELHLSNFYGGPFVPPQQSQRPDRMSLSEKDRTAIDAAGPSPPLSRRISRWSFGMGRPKVTHTSGQSDTPNFSLPISTQPVHGQTAGPVSNETAKSSPDHRASQLPYLLNDIPVLEPLSNVTERTPPLKLTRRNNSIRPRTAPGEMVKYSSGSNDSIMFELVASRDIATAQPDPSQDTQWSRASANNFTSTVDHAPRRAQDLLSDDVEVGQAHHPTELEDHAGSTMNIIAHYNTDSAAANTQDQSDILNARLDYSASQDTTPNRIPRQHRVRVPRRDCYTPPPSTSGLPERARSPSSPPRPLKSAKRPCLTADVASYQPFPTFQ